VSTHAPPHGTRPAGHEVLHIPDEQICPPAHDTPQAPQFAESVLVAVQRPAQIACPGGHEQVPPRQVCPLGHATPHAPQLNESLFRSTQPPPQASSPGPHDATQVPALHRGVAVAQTAPQAPQFAGSVAGLTQAPPHAIDRAVHVQMPAPHT
jgi:hypothetical protein